ncbi:glycosyltransferase [Demequina sp. SYSU T00068]|uniref:glycosyltransferase n=1 Tax=Demequina lignilytica TaxID=3051663 RepID=UPI0026323DA2|nr:glycosyltransferase [Demequina sp. SYSU T00068]MDN4490105.1 glycosyltransferase [Demequina sp. SYSU T00068]
MSFGLQRIRSTPSLLRRLLHRLPASTRTQLSEAKRRARRDWLIERPRRATRRARRRAQVRAKLRSLPLRDQVIYESNYGAGVLCNPEAIFRTLHADPAYGRLSHVWVLKNGRTARGVQQEFASDPRVRFVRYGSWEYIREMYRSRYLVNNSTWPTHFSKRPGQVYVNTWHGTPLKHMGYDMPDGALQSANTLRNFLMADYLVSPNEHTTRRMYLDAYRLDGVFTGTIIETGYPRVDRSLRMADDRRSAREWLEQFGVACPDGPTTVLFAPTWRGASFSSPQDDAEEVADTVLELQELLGDDFFVMLKVHPQVADGVAALPDLVGRLVGNDAPTAGALAAADVLVTDYSSIFFDYLPLRRPLVFFVPDSDDYQRGRGTYLPVESLPGSTVSTLEDLAGAVRDAVAEPALAPGLEDFAERFAPYEDGDASSRVVDVVFGGAKRLDVGALVTAGRTKPRMMIHLGGMLPNGITASALNLVRNLDYDTFDITVNVPWPKGESQEELIRGIDPRARIVFTFDGVAEEPYRVPLRRLRRRVVPFGSPPRRARVTRAFSAEWRRIFGDAQFDAVVDFSGYSPRHAGLMLGAPGGRTSIWLHNDIAADQLRTVLGKQPHYVSLAQTISLYPHYDSLVSVSDALAEVNRESLGTPATRRRFLAAHNVIDAQRILAGAGPDAVRAEVEASSAAGLPRRVLAARERALAPVDRRKVFVSVGRLSTEKNHARLLEAFSIVVARHPDSRLVIVGDGPLRNTIRGLVRGLGLVGHVDMVGHTSNPFAYIANAGCLTMSSDHEGQPMVILEARVLGLPVVTTRFSSADSAVDSSFGLIVDQDASALAEGMLAYLEGKVPSAPFDYDSYNRQCLREFYSATGMWEFVADRFEPTSA